MQVKEPSLRKVYYTPATPTAAARGGVPRADREIRNS
jgi:hypothetical protein